MITADHYRLEHKDHHGRWHWDCARRADKVATLELARYYRLLLGRTGAYTTGAIPGGGVATDVRVVTVGVAS